MNSGYIRDAFSWDSTLPYPILVAACGLITLAVATGIPPVGLKLDWWQYLTLGIILPVAVLLLWRRGLFSTITRTSVLYQLAFVILQLFVLFGCSVLWVSKTIFDFTASFILTLITMGIWLFRDKQKWPFGNMREWASVVMAFAVSVAMWSSAISLIHWTTFHNFLFHSWYSLVVFAVIVLIVHYVLFGWGYASHASGHFLSIKHVGPLLIICLLSFRNIVFEPTAVHHWSFFVGPVDIIRQGGLLLWNVPSQYGFLNLWLVALVPWTNSWETFYLFQAVLLVAVGTCLYFTLYTYRPSMCIFATVSSILAVLFIPGGIARLAGQQMYPSVGPLRFFWCYVLVITFFVWCQWGRTMNRFTIAVIGGIPWVAGIFWSAESAIYCSVIYLSSLLALLLQETFGDRIGTRDNNHGYVRQVIRFFSVPAAYLILVGAIISVSYYLKIGRLPDIFSYIEYGLVYAGGLGYIPIDWRGPVWLLFCLICATATITLLELKENPTGRGVIVGVALSACIWSVSSYFVGRAHPNNVFNLCPIMFLVMWIVLIRMRNWKECAPNNFNCVLIKMAFIPIITIMLGSALVNPHIPKLIGTLTTADSFKLDITSKLPIADKDLQLLIDQAQISPKDPLAFYDEDVSPWESVSTVPLWRDKNGNLVLSSRSWLPKPLKMLLLLPEERQRIYVNRFLTRENFPGWFILRRVPKDLEDPLLPLKISRLLPSWIQATLFGQNQRWRLVRVDALSQK